MQNTFGTNAIIFVMVPVLAYCTESIGFSGRGRKGIKKPWAPEEKETKYDTAPKLLYTRLSLALLSDGGITWSIDTDYINIYKWIPPQTHPPPHTHSLFVCLSFSPLLIHTNTSMCLHWDTQWVFCPVQFSLGIEDEDSPPCEGNAQNDFAPVDNLKQRHQSKQDWVNEERCHNMRERERETKVDDASVCILQIINSRSTHVCSPTGLCEWREVTCNTMIYILCIHIYRYMYMYI